MMVHHQGFVTYVCRWLKQLVTDRGTGAHEDQVSKVQKNLSSWQQEGSLLYGRAVRVRGLLYDPP